MRGGTGSVNLREFFKYAIFGFWSKIQKLYLRLLQQLFRFFQNLTKPADIYTRASCTCDKV